jgi:uncharacterized membrane protein
VPRWAFIAALAFVAVGCGSEPGGLFLSSSTDPQAERSDFCDAFAVVERKCLRCHADPPQNGAPFALNDYAAITAPSPSSAEPDRTRADRMLAAVRANRMPDTELSLEPPVEELTCEERTTLIDWLTDGAAPPASGDTSCAHATPKLLGCDPAL